MRTNRTPSTVNSSTTNRGRTEEILLLRGNENSFVTLDNEGYNDLCLKQNIFLLEIVEIGAKMNFRDVN